MSTHHSEGITASAVLLGAILEDQGDFKTAIKYYKKGMESYPALDDIYWVNMRIGLCYKADGNYAHAIKAFQVCLQRGRETGERVKIGWSLLNKGDTLLLQGNPTEAEQNLKQAHELFQEVGTTIGVLWSTPISRFAI